MNYIKLPLQFDTDRLTKDLTTIADREWHSHYNPHNYSGSWSVASLYAINGDKNFIYSVPNAERRYQPTEILERCSYFKEVLSKLECEKSSVRLMRLSSGSEIREHCDDGLDFEEGEVRLHIPITTNPDLEFYHCDDIVTMNAGECWYMNFTLRHKVINKGESDRVHIVMDCYVNDWLRDLFKEAGYIKSEKKTSSYEVRDEDIDHVITSLEEIDSETSRELIKKLKERKNQNK